MADPHVGGDESRAILVGLWFAMAIAIVVVILRVIAQVKIRRFAVDDVLMLLTFVCAALFAFQ